MIVYMVSQSDITIILVEIYIPLFEKQRKYPKGKREDPSVPTFTCVINVCACQRFYPEESFS